MTIVPHMASGPPAAQESFVGAMVIVGAVDVVAADRAEPDNVATAA